MAVKQYRFSRSAVLARVRLGPVKLAELAQGSENHLVRKRLMRHVEKLLAEGVVKKRWMNGYPHYLLADAEPTVDQHVQTLLDNCKPIDGCMVWADHIDPQRGPIGRVDGKVVSVRRFIWRSKRGEIGRDQIVRMQDTCEHGCCEYAHMTLGARGEAQRGRVLQPSLVLRITEAVRRAKGKLDWAAVRAIRASDEPQHVLASRYRVSPSLIGQVRRHEVWKEPGGMFTGLIRRAA
ncbi:hypothetical protein [Acidovorax sp. SDU_ACID1]|uniref:hypothetical protein n=1 Tax=Acidovorax sp. SDU_ACID1 TaxID=3136632 RepID=UPI0038730E78